MKLGLVESDVQWAAAEVPAAASRILQVLAPKRESPAGQIAASNLVRALFLQRSSPACSTRLPQALAMLKKLARVEVDGNIVAQVVRWAALEGTARSASHVDCGT